MCWGMRVQSSIEVGEGRHKACSYGNGEPAGLVGMFLA